VKFRAGVRALRPTDTGEAMAAYRSEYGRGARRRLAQDYDVTPDTAGRWLSGKQAPSTRGGKRQQVLAAAPGARVAANRIRGARAVSVGTVTVYDNSGGRSGKRNIGILPVDHEMRQQLNEVADLVEQDQLSKANELMSVAVLEGYSKAKSKGDKQSIPTNVLSISDYGSLDFI